MSKEIKENPHIRMSKDGSGWEIVVKKKFLFWTYWKPIKWFPMRGPAESYLHEITHYE